MAVEILPNQIGQEQPKKKPPFLRTVISRILYFQFQSLDPKVAKELGANFLTYGHSSIMIKTDQDGQIIKAMLTKPDGVTVIKEESL